MSSASLGLWAFYVNGNQEQKENQIQACATIEDDSLREQCLEDV